MSIEEEVPARSAIRTDVAVLYVDPRGVYPSMVADVWDEERNAFHYAGPMPVVAHPPCGQWGALRNLQRVRRNMREAMCAVFAVDQVRRWGGVLEHPARSSLWDTEQLPRPGALPDAWGGWTLEVDQVRFGHAAQKRTWLYIVGITTDELPPPPPPPPPPTKTVENMGHQERRRTPPAFAEWLLEVASRCRR